MIYAGSNFDKGSHFNRRANFNMKRGHDIMTHSKKGDFSTLKSDLNLLKNDPGHILTVENRPEGHFSTFKNERAGYLAMGSIFNFTGVLARRQNFFLNQKALPCKNKCRFLYRENMILIPKYATAAWRCSF